MVGLVALRPIPSAQSGRLIRFTANSSRQKSGPLPATTPLMTVKNILLSMSENLPDDATIYDAINQLEFTATLLEDAAFLSKKPEPSWLYESSSRVSAVRHQCHRF